MNQTISKFGYPATLVREYDHWVVLMRPVQATLGALILACKDEATAFADISPAAFSELGTAVGDLERVLASTFAYRKLNYLMLMMVDPDVHFHVLPRYDKEQTFAGGTFSDPGWPAAPNIGHVNEIDDAVRDELLKTLRRAFS